jgi:hypothetical protein
MNYQFKAMQKTLSSVGVSSSFSDRPVYQEIKLMANVTNPADLDRNLVAIRIKEIEDIIARTKNTTIASEKVKAVMVPINNQLIEGLEKYLAAWNMLITFHDKKWSEQAKEEKIEEQVVLDEDIDECPEDEEYVESEIDKMYNKMLTLAEDAEILLLDAEKIMKDTFDDNNLEGDN